MIFETNKAQRPVKPKAPQRTELDDAIVKAVAAERERILRIVYEHSQYYGLTGECLWIAIKAYTRKGNTS